MKRFLFFVFFATFLVQVGFADNRQKDLSGIIAIKGELQQVYENYPTGTPVIIRKVVKMGPGSERTAGVYYAVEINGLQIPMPKENLKMIKLAPPETFSDFWQHIYLEQHLYEYFSETGYRTELRQEVDEECLDYLNKLNGIAYKDDYITSYVQSIFAKLAANNIDPNRIERLNVRVIQSPDPDAYMLPNGSMLVSTGLLSTLDSEDELAAIIANEMAHYVLDHQINNIYRAERNVQRAAFWGSILAATADAAFDVAYWNDDDKALGIGAIASIGSIATLVNVRVVDRLGMNYKVKQEISADRIAEKLLAFRGFNPDGLSSALSKITAYYDKQKRTNDLTRYGSIKNLQKRIEKIGEVQNLSNHPYLKATSDIVTFNAAMNLSDQRYQAAAQLIQKNIDNNLATDNDYVLLTKAEMALYNTNEINEKCLTLLQKAQELAGDSPNLDIYKQKILLLLRMNKQAKAADTLKEYITLLSKFQEQGASNEDKDWAAKEMGWGNQLLDKISRM
ncbi:MAG: M48 family metalloprotease [Bacteroides sp.]|jgi:predicted Zn-dependent protease|nr:M48 family metalloprotease [Bacteroides sp.]MCI1683139.1 M48 family metalloprotease [Bacteroides sp.]